MDSHSVHDGKPQMLGSGRTTKQMLNAPKGALFIWCSENATTASHIAQGCGRGDLVVVGVDVLQRVDAFDGLRGRKFPSVILDHWLADHGLDPRQMDFYQRLLSMVRP